MTKPPCFGANYLKSLSTIVLVLSILVALISCNGGGGGGGADGEESQTMNMELQGDVSAIYSSGTFVLWVPEVESLGGVVSLAIPDPTSQTPSVALSSSTTRGSASTSRGSGSTLTFPVGSSSSAASGSTTTSSMTTNLLATQDSVPQGAIVLASALIEEGKFSLSLNAEEIKPVNFAVIGTDRVNNPFKMPIRNQIFILEPGKLTLTMDKHEQFVVSGGTYNDAVINSWKQSDGYAAALKLYQEQLSGSNPSTAQERFEQIAATRAQFTALVNLESEGRQEIALYDPDLLVRRLTLQTTTVTTGTWYTKAMTYLKENATEDPWIAKILERDQKHQTQIELRDSVAIGTPILDFEAVDLDGASIALSTAHKDAKVVLLDFWASWCGPCRTELPYLRSAYEKFKDKGFEIVSFTLDDEHEDWELASEEEQISWINLGLGSQAEAVRTYSVLGIPYSLLYEVETGTIVAKNLSGGELEVKVAEFLP